MATLSRASSINKPMSVEQIVKLASESFFSIDFSMQNWFRSADLMLRQTNIYEHEGNDQMAYFLLYRYAHLILDDLTKHPHARDSEYRESWAAARKSVKTSLAKLEVLKPRINKRYEKYQERRRVAAAARGVTPQAREVRRPSADALIEETRRMSLDSQGSSRGDFPARLDAEEHRNMAVEFANREMQRRRGYLAQTPSAANNGTADLRSICWQLEAGSQLQQPAQQSQPQSYGATYNHPHVPERSKQPTPSIGSSTNGTPSQVAPSLPPKNSLDSGFNGSPLLPSKIPDASRYSSPPPLPPTISAPTPPPHPSASTPPPTTQFSTPSSLESGAPLRTLFLPMPLRHSFLRLASTNTSRNLETLGLLLGTLIRNAFFITHLLIPAQTSTSDTCEMLHEEQLYEYIEKESESGRGELMVLGWIHTHPSQTCFLSSRDLHTQVWYQVSLPESIAVVCAPSKSPDYGIFRLTDPPGVTTIRACKASGIFHPHDVGNLYTDALGRPGHVIEHEGLGFEVVDLRGKG